MKKPTLFTFLIIQFTLYPPMHAMMENKLCLRKGNIESHNLDELHTGNVATPIAQLYQRIGEPRVGRSKIDPELERLELALVDHLLRRYTIEQLSDAEAKHIRIKIKELFNTKHLNTTTLKGGTFLHYAAAFADQELVTILLACGANKEALHRYNKQLPILIARTSQSQFPANTKEYKAYQRCINLLAEQEPPANDDSSF